MEIFSDAKGQLTPKSVFGFGQNLNSVETLWLSRLLAKVMKILLKLKAVEWSQDYMSIFQTSNGR